MSMHIMYSGDADQAEQAYLGELLQFSQEDPVIRKTYAVAMESAQEKWKWYRKRAEHSKHWSQWLLMLAVVSTTLAGIVPILPELSATWEWTVYIDPAWSTVLIAFSALLVSANTLANNTNNWKRFAKTQKWFEAQIGAFYCEMQEEVASRETQKAFARSCRKFLTDIGEREIDETNQWTRELNQALRQITQQAAASKVQAQATQVHVSVENGEQFRQGWHLSLHDGSTVQMFEFTGSEAMVDGLSPGDYQVAASASRNQKQYRADPQEVHIREGEKREIPLVLSEWSQEPTQAAVEEEPENKESLPDLKPLNAPISSGEDGVNPPTAGEAPRVDGSETQADMELISSAAQESDETTTTTKPSRSNGSQ